MRKTAVSPAVFTPRNTSSGLFWFGSTSSFCTSWCTRVSPRLPNFTSTVYAKGPLGASGLVGWGVTWTPPPLLEPGLEPLPPDGAPLPPPAGCDELFGAGVGLGCAAESTALSGLKGSFLLKTPSVETCVVPVSATTTALLLSPALLALAAGGVLAGGVEEFFFSTTGTATRATTSRTATGQRRFARRSCQSSRSSLFIA